MLGHTMLGFKVTHRNEQFMCCCWFLQSFAKPMLFLSLTSVVANAYTEARERKSTHKDPTLHLSVVEPATGEVTEEEVVVHDKLLPSIALLRQELDKRGVLLSER